MNRRDVWRWVRWPVGAVVAWLSFSGFYAQLAVFWPFGWFWLRNHHVGVARVPVAAAVAVVVVAGWQWGREFLAGRQSGYRMHGGAPAGLTAEVVDAEVVDEEFRR